MTENTLSFYIPIKITEATAGNTKRKLAGIAALPRISKNGNLYLPEELAALDNTTVPLLYRHAGTPQTAYTINGKTISEPIPEQAVIGSINFQFDPQTWQLKYTAEAELPDSVLAEPLGVSIGAFIDKNSPHVCGTKNCYTVARNLRVVEASLVPNPGIPETTVKIVEHYHTKQCGLAVSSENSASGELKPLMADNEVTTKPAEAKAAVTNTINGITAEQFEAQIKGLSNSISTTVSEAYKNTQQVQLDKLTEAIGALKVIPKEPEASSPVSDAKPAVVTPNPTVEEYKKVVEWFSNARKQGAHDLGNMGWTLDKDYYMKMWGYDTTSDLKKIKEDVTYSAPPQGYVKKAIFIPGGRLKVPVRQFCDFKSLDGEDRANWYTIGGVDFAAGTEGSSPFVTASSETITQKTATPAVRGAFQKIKYTQIEDQPFDLVATVNMAFALAAIDDEANDLLNTVYAAVSPTNWVRGDTGAEITADDTASLVFKREGIAHAKRLIAQQGYDTSPGNLVVFMHPKQYTELLLDTNITTFTQYARSDVTVTGLLEQIYGVDIVVSDQVELKDNTTNDTYRAVMAVKGQAFGMASARDVQMEASRRNELQQVFLTATQRVKSVVLDEKASCRISTGI